MYNYWDFSSKVIPRPADTRVIRNEGERVMISTLYATLNGLYVEQQKLVGALKYVQGGTKERMEQEIRNIGARIIDVMDQLAENKAHVQ